jgi:hypothetical protein
MNKYKIFSIAVDTSILLRGILHYFRFRGITLKYHVSQKQGDTDCLTGHFPVPGYTLNNAYKFLTEFLSLWSFETDEIVMPGFGIESGTLFLDEISALKANIIATEHVKVPKTTICDTIYYLPKIETEVQDKAVRLYRQARSCVDAYSQLLFFWHTLVYPSKDDKDAQDYIQKFVDSDISEYSHVYSDIDRLIEYTNKNKDGAFGKELDRKGIGRYIREDVRHAIAHIVRDQGRSLEIDNMYQLAHIKTIGRILRYISRYKIQHTHSLSLDKPHGMDYFMILKNSDYK